MDLHGTGEFLITSENTDDLIEVMVTEPKGDFMEREVVWWVGLVLQELFFLLTKNL